MLLVATAIAVSVVTVASVVTSTAATVASATASFTAQTVYHALYLFVGRISVFYTLTFEVERFSGQRMVQVHLHRICSDFKHATVEAVAVFVLQRHYSIFEYVFVVEMTVDAEHSAFQIEYAPRFIVTVGLVFCKSEIEVRAFSSPAICFSNDSRVTPNPLINRNGRSCDVSSISSLSLFSTVYSLYVTAMYLFCGFSILLYSVFVIFSGKVTHFNQQTGINPSIIVWSVVGMKTGDGYVCVVILFL